jgi:hypothetical protein
MNNTYQHVYLTIPSSDMKFFKEFVAKMGWQIAVKESFLKDYIASRPKHVPLSDEEIQAEVTAIRYSNANNH